jgi:hypothetical protein
MRNGPRTKEGIGTVRYRSAQTSAGKPQNGKGEESEIIKPFGRLLFKILSGIPIDKSWKLQTGADGHSLGNRKFFRDGNRKILTIIGKVGKFGKS